MTLSAARTRWVPVIAAASLLAACDSGTDPVAEYDPLETLDRMDAVVEPLDVGDAVLDGLWLATEELYAYGAEPLADLVRVTGASVLEASLPDGRALRAVAERRLARETNGLAGGLEPELAFPSSLLGRTLVWDAVDGYVVDPDATGAPPNGVRIIYYLTDGTGYPTSSLTPLGFIDLTDEDGSLVERVGVRVVRYGASVAQDLEVADYTIALDFSGSSAAGMLSYEMNGSLDNGADAVQVDLTQRFTWSDAENYDRLTLDYLFDTDRGLVTFAVEAESAFEALDWETVEFQVVFGANESDEVEVQIGIAPDGSLSGVFRKRGRTVIEVTGTDGNPVFSRPGRSTLSASETQALEAIWVGISDTMSLTVWLMVPADLLLLPG